MHAFDCAHRLLVHHVDELNTVQAVHHAHFARELIAAGRVGFDHQRGDKRAGFLDGDLRRAVGLRVLRVAPGR